MVVPTKLDKKLKQISRILANPNAKVLFFTGAGISATSDGEPLIPDFRSPGTGLFYNLAKLNLPTPESIFDIDFFRENPKPFYSLCKDLHPELAKFPPTRFHYFMKLVNDHNNLVRIFTQNIDCLERATGIDAEKIVEAHGSFADEFCIECKRPADKKHFTKQLLAGDVPECEFCKGTLKPAIVFYGEQLPAKFFDCSESDISEDVDLCIFAGTSLNVYPFASLAAESPSKSVRVLINKEEVGDFLYSPRQSDILALRDCDEIADIIAQHCGWKEELDRLVDSHKGDKKQHAKTASEMVDDMRKDKNLKKGTEVKTKKETAKEKKVEEKQIKGKDTKDAETSERISEEKKEKSKNEGDVEDLAEDLEHLKLDQAKGAKPLEEKKQD